MKMNSIYFPLTDLEYQHLAGTLKDQINGAGDVYQKQFLLNLFAKLDKAKVAHNGRIEAHAEGTPVKKGKR